MMIAVAVGFLFTVIVRADTGMVVAGIGAVGIRAVGDCCNRIAAMVFFYVYVTAHCADADLAVAIAIDMSSVKGSGIKVGVKSTA